MKTIALFHGRVVALRHGQPVEVPFRTKPELCAGEWVCVGEEHDTQIGNGGDHVQVIYRASPEMGAWTDAWLPADAMPPELARSTVRVTHVVQEALPARWIVRVAPGPWCADWRPQHPSKEDVRAHIRDGGWWCVWEGHPIPPRFVRLTSDDVRISRIRIADGDVVCPCNFVGETIAWRDIRVPEGDAR